MLLLSLLLSGLLAGPSLGATIETTAPAAAAKAAPALSAGVLRSLDLQVQAMRPALGDPARMAQALVEHQTAQADGMAAALILKRALTEPEAFRAVQASLAELPVAGKIAALRRSIEADPGAATAFQRALGPLEGALSAGRMPEQVGPALDALFEGSAARAAAEVAAGPAGRARSGLKRYRSRNFARLWSDPALRLRAIGFYVNGIMTGDSALANEFVAHTDALLRANPRLADAEIYPLLRRYIEQRARAFERAANADDDGRVSLRVEQIKGFVAGRPRSILDIGAGEGRIAQGLKKLWRLPASRAHALDVAAYGEARDLHWIVYDKNGSIPLADGSVDLITCLMVLHHVERPEQVLKEARRVLRDGGKMIVRETDGSDAGDVLFSAVMDEMFYRVFHDIPGVPVPWNYQPAGRWQAMFERLGFAVTMLPADEGDNPFRPVYFLLEKKPAAPKP